MDILKIITSIIAMGFLIFMIGTIYYLRSQRKKLVKKLLDEQKEIT